MKIAIVGGGVAGIVSSLTLREAGHDITLFERESHLGGHTNTICVARESGTWHVDTGFIVLNDRNYPNFNRLLAAKGVAIQPSHMGFSVKGEDEDFEYAGTPRGLFCQPRNAVSPSFLRMITDLTRFNRMLRAMLLEAPGPGPGPSLREWVEREGFSRRFIDALIVPQASAVWSADPAGMWEFPVRFLAEFFSNHGMLGFSGRPQWQTVVGGSHAYVTAFTAGWEDRIRLASPVESVSRSEVGVSICVRGVEQRTFERVVFACHADQALAMLADPSPLEKELLGAFPFQHNEAVLHTDESLLPRRRAAWQAWNFHLFAQPRPLTTITYYMNHLQRLNAPEHFCVSLNMTDRIDPAKIIRKIDYTHPVYTAAGVAAQARHGELNGQRGTHYCGAYWGWGFHEDGVLSALRSVASVPRASGQRTGVRL